MPTNTGAFDAVFTAAGTPITTTPIRAPRANAICERWADSAARAHRPDPPHRPTATSASGDVTGLAT